MRTLEGNSVVGATDCTNHQHGIGWPSSQHPLPQNSSRVRSIPEFTKNFARDYRRSTHPDLRLVAPRRCTLACSTWLVGAPTTSTPEREMERVWISWVREWEGRDGLGWGGFVCKQPSNFHRLHGYSSHIKACQNGTIPKASKSHENAHPNPNATLPIPHHFSTGLAQNRRYTHSDPNWVDRVKPPRTSPMCRTRSTNEKSDQIYLNKHTITQIDILRTKLCITEESGLINIIAGERFLQPIPLK